MTDCIYVLGAGFSAGAGGPLVDSFSDSKFLRKFATKLKTNERQQFARVMEHIMPKIRDGWCENIEEVLSHLHVAEQLEVLSMSAIGSQADSYDARDLRNDLEWYIEKGIDLMMQKPRPYYDTFLMKEINDDDAIITFNYDILVERIFNRNRKLFDYGFDRRKKRGRFLLKLHGSLNWGYCARCRQLYYEKGRNIALELSKNSIKCPACKRSRLRTVIVPPILDKSLYFNKKGRSGFDLITLWQQAMDSIIKAKKIVFIGYSLTKSDFYARKLFQIGINMNEHYGDFEVLLINRNRSMLKHYSEALNVPEKDINFHPERFENHVNHCRYSKI